MTKAHVRAGKRNASRGAKWERWVKDWMEGRGWTVFRSAGSHGASDLVALKPSLEEGVSVVRLVSCRSTQSEVKDPWNLLWSPVEKNVLCGLARDLHAQAVFAAKVGKCGRYLFDGDDPSTPEEMT